MNGNFLRFKRRRNAIRIIRSCLIGISVGLTLGGAWLLLWKLAVINIPPVSSLYIGIGSMLISGGLTFLLSGKRDKRFAEELDSEFNLKARVQTMVEYMGETGELVSMQRQDTDKALSRIPLKKYKFKRIWIYLVALLFSLGILAAGILVNDVRKQTPPEEIIPFQLSSLQETGLYNLIKYVEGSEMEEEFRLPLAEELRGLLGRLREINTQPEMLAALDSSMRAIKSITDESSTSTEVLNALWESGNIYFKHLAKTLDSSEWSEPDWGDFAEKLTDYAGVLMGDDKNVDSEGSAKVNGKDNLRSAIDSMSLKLKSVLNSAGVGEDDEICAAINGMFNGGSGGFTSMLTMLDYVDEEGARRILNTCLTENSEPLFAAISLNKINANVGEYVMIRLTGLFIVPLPEFERPDFVKNGESVGGNDGTNNDKNNNVESDGGIGEGAIYGSNDIVIDPLTGELVEYGELLNKYNAIMYERLEGDSYTEEQKEAIRKYFGLLYSGIEKPES